MIDRADEAEGVCPCSVVSSLAFSLCQRSRAAVNHHHHRFRLLVGAVKEEEEDEEEKKKLATKPISGTAVSICKHAHKHVLPETWNRERSVNDDGNVPICRQRCGDKKKPPRVSQVLLCAIKGSRRIRRRRENDEDCRWAYTEAWA